MIEIWKDVVGYEGLYEVSNLGHIKSLWFNKEKLLTPINSKGYYKVHLYKNGKLKDYSIHQIVAKAFIPNPNNYPGINHKDEVKTNNHADNLEWCNDAYNAVYGTRRERIAATLRGSHHSGGGGGKGNKRGPRSEETKRKISESMIGRHHSEETKRRMSKARKRFLLEKILQGKDETTSNSRKEKLWIIKVFH